MGWVLSVLDQINPPINPAPAVGVLPLGTGNDLARALGWGGVSLKTKIGDLYNDTNGTFETGLHGRADWEDFAGDWYVADGFNGPLAFASDAQ